MQGSIALWKRPAISRPIERRFDNATGAATLIERRPTEAVVAHDFVAGRGENQTLQTVVTQQL